MSLEPELITNKTSTTTSQRTRRRVAAVLAMLAVILGGFSLAQEAGAYAPVGLQAPCTVSWPANTSTKPAGPFYVLGNKVVTMRDIKCYRGGLGSGINGFVGGHYKVATITASTVGINNYSNNLGFIVCKRSWGSVCRYSGSGNI